MATDIAFALGVVALLGNRISTSLRIFLAALAIADDIGAVLVIALFYTETISAAHLAIAGGFLVALIASNRAGIRHPLVYAILGIGLWVAFLHSGIHATVAGVLLAMTIPARRRIDGRAFLEQSEKILGEFHSAEQLEDSISANARKSTALHHLARDCERAESPMLRFEHALAPWVSYVIMPVFALANAGVALGSDIGRQVVDPVSLGIICGLALGKPLGVVGFSWVSNRVGVTTLPAGTNWRQIFGVGALAGIGFTMSLFIADLAFGSTPLLETAKVGILVASLISGVVGAIILLKRTSPKS
jgi:NhaA family Na+:H+ antiporter